MSLFDYEVSIDLERHDLPFNALIMAAMRRADTDNMNMLKAMWPAVYDELHARYHAPGRALNAEEVEQATKSAEPDGYGLLGDDSADWCVSFDLSAPDGAALANTLGLLEDWTADVVHKWLRSAAPAGTVTTEVCIST